MFRFYVIIGMVLIITAASGGVFYMQKRIEKLAEETVQLEIQNQSLQAEIAYIEKFAMEQELRMNALSTELQTANDGLVSLRKILADHDLTRLALEKPGLIENRINSATTRLFNELMKETQ